MQDGLFAFFTKQSAAALFAGWPLVIGVVVRLAGYLGIRGVVP